MVERAWPRLLSAPEVTAAAFTRPGQLGDVDGDPSALF
jgi:hypothetical protein